MRLCIWGQQRFPYSADGYLCEISAPTLHTHIGEVVKLHFTRHPLLITALAQVWSLDNSVDPNDANDRVYVQRKFS